jgi:diguanylate cyclase (GGDEF)-like protein
MRVPPEAARRSRLAENLQYRAFVSWIVLGIFNFLRRSAGFLIAFAALGLAVMGVFRDPSRTSTPQLLALGGLTLLLLVRLFERLQRIRGARGRAIVADAELGTLFIGAAFAIIEITGGPDGLLYPIIYALVGFLVAFHGSTLSAYFLLVILGTEAGITFMQPTAEGWRLFASHASFNVLFGFLYALFLRSEVAQRRKSFQRELDDHMRTISDEAKEFRLTSALSFEGRNLNPDQLQRRRQIGSVKAIHDSLYNVLAVAERAIGSHTVALLWMDSDDKHLRVKELRSASDNVTEKPIATGEGVLGAITKRREPLLLTKLKPGHSGLVYYGGPETVTDFIGVPVLENGHLRGVLVADRVRNESFDTNDLSVMQTIAEEIVRAVQVERIFADMDREKYQKERFYQASRDFNSALTLDKVAEVAIEAACRVTQAEFAAVAVSTDDEGVLSIAAARWSGNQDEAKELVGKRFKAGRGLVGASIKARHALPHGTARMASQKIFSDEIQTDLDAVKVIPLLWKGIGVGALVLGAEKEDFLPFDMLDMVRVIADHAAIAIANAQMYERMERMATTDGLTSLVNHRYFQELFETMMAGAERYSRKVSMLLMDIDFFKSINDTYGHPVGDQVLRKVARILENSARRIDVVARYGGEEFAVLMDETDREGAMLIAERIRAAVEEELFRCENGTFNCTISVGLATFPHDADSKVKLTECADQALYKAKHDGRNRIVSSHTLRGKS